MGLVILIVAGVILLGIHLLILKCWFKHIEEVIREINGNQPNQDNKQNKTSE